MKTSRMFNRQILLVSLVISSFSAVTAQTSCCEEGSKPKQITLKYTGESCSATNTSQPDSKVGCSGDPANDPMVYIIANNNDDASSGDIWFSGEVALDANFTVDATNAGQTKLTSNTVIHVFSSQNGTKIQTINFHTSCSVPLILGDQFGSIVLVGMVSPDGTICGPDDPEVSCVRTLTNTESCVGNKTYVLYLEDTTGVKYWLTGASSTYKWQELSDGTVRVTGDGFTHPSLTGDLFSFDILLSDSTSTAPAGSPKSSYCTTVSTDNWIYFETVSGTVNSAIHGSFSVNRRGSAFQQGKDANTTQAGYGASGWFDMQEGDGFFDVGDVNAMLSETCSTPEVESCCVDGFKPAKITLTYTGEDCSATVTSQSTDKYNCSGNPSFDNLVYIIANDDNSATSGNIWFSGEVALDSSFTLDAGAQGASNLPSNTVIHVFDAQGGTKIQTVNFHTSCSQPINSGDQYGSLQIVGMISETGASCGLPEDPPSDSESCCVDGFKPAKITLTYTGEDCLATVTSQSTDKYNCSGNPSFDNLVYIIANDNNSATSGNIWFSGEVALDSSFTLDAGAQGASKLPSNTVIHVFDAQGGTEIQTVNFHTSCSQPINTGDQYGSLQIVGMISETGASCGLPEDPPSDSESCCVDGFKPAKITLTYTGEDCSATVTSQSTDKYNCSGNPSFDALVYIIANDDNSATSGDIWFSGEVALDSSFTLDAGAQGASKLPSNTVIHVFDAQGGTEIQTVNFHTSCSQPINTGDQYGSLQIVGMISETGASCGLPEDPPSEKESCCVSGFKPQTITMMYTGDDCSATSTSQSSDKYNCSGDPANDTEVFIIANDNNSATSGQIWFSGAVPLNSLFTLDATAQGQTRFPSNTVIHIFNHENGTEVQTVNFHTSCSQPLVTGDQWGSVKLVKMVSENGATCGSIEGNGLVNLINGYTFYDLNQSAIFDNGEPVIPTMSVLLYADNNCDGEVDGGDTYLDEAVTDASGFYQFSRPWMGGPFELRYGLTSDNDDGEQKSDGSIDLGHGDLHLGEGIAGLHFKDINVPSGVTITSAYIEFTSYNDESGVVAVRINAQDADNGSPLGGSTNNFSSRTKTSAQVDWNLSDWTSDTKYNSPDISAIVQELVDRAGWNALNEVSLFVNPLSGTNRRKAVSQDRSALTSPKLIINYDIAGYKECYVTHVDTTTEPDGNSITTYHTEVAVFTSGGNVDSMNNFGFYGELPAGTNLITGTVFADINEDADYADPEFGIANIEVSLYKDVDCDNELTGADLWMRKTTTNDIGFYQFAVDYEPLTNGTTFSISSDNNDSEEETNGDVDLSHGDLHLNERIVGLRYQNVSIPAGATIQSATLEMVSKNDENGAAQVRIFAEDVNSASSLTNADYDLSTRTTTTASQNWSLDPWTQDIVYNSPDFSNVIQEVVDRGGWSSGNNLSLIIKSVNGSGKRKAYSHDGDQSKVTKLIVTYTINGANDCYITRIGKVWPAEYEYLTTDSINDQVFTGVDQVDSLNDFGLWGPDAVPVELLNFEAFWSANNAVLRWTTASEENNSFFEIQRSTNAVDFLTIGKEYSKALGGNSLSILNYEVSDLYIKDRIEELVFYRLKQVDYDGTSALSHIVVLAKSTAYPVNELQVYPNPSTDVAFVNFKRNMSTQGTIKILGATGQVVYSELIPQGGIQESIKLDVSHLDRGIYYIQFESNGSFYTKRFVIDRS